MNILTNDQAAQVLLTMQMAGDEELRVKDRTEALAKALEWYQTIETIRGVNQKLNYVGSNFKRETFNHKKNS